MKIRSGFVSNSSSSSFIVISQEGYQPFRLGSFVKIPDHFYDSTYEFGWGPGRISDTESKINFAYLQCLDVNNEEWLELLEEVLKEETGVEKIVWNFAKSYEDRGIEGYIDHQSSAGEGKNTQIFESKETLRAFLFNNGSYIQLDNDNH